MNWFDKVYEDVLMTVVPWRAYNLARDYVGAVEEVKQTREVIKTRIRNKDFNGALIMIGTVCNEFKRASDLRERLVLTNQGRRELLKLSSTYSDVFRHQTWLP